MKNTERTALQIIINALFVLSYITAFGFFVFTMVYGFTQSSMEYVPALAIMMAIMNSLGEINKRLNKKEHHVVEA